jgi:hypothetical protein
MDGLAHVQLFAVGDFKRQVPGASTAPLRARAADVVAQVELERGQQERAEASSFRAARSK